MPFELNQDWNYSNPAVQADIMSRFSDWVMRYRANPAVRMWAPGNENLHGVLYPNWVIQAQVPAARTQAFAAFLPRLVDRIHELDPNHHGAVLGGRATNGPVDRGHAFGLVDANGKPCDAALSPLAAAYLNDPSPADSAGAADVVND